MAKRNKQEEKVREILEEKQEEDSARAGHDPAQEDSAQDEPTQDELDPSVESVRRAAAERR
jgi:hypothetical protein